MQITATLKVPLESKLGPTELNNLKTMFVESFWPDFVRAVERVRGEFPEATRIGPAVVPKLALVEIAMGLGHHEAAMPAALTLVKRGACHLTKAKSLKLR